jgi:RNA polymerase sigma-70 factor (ECF subfamily)
VLESCLKQLPVMQARLFLMREWLELSSEEICKELQLTPTNLYVQLHRARLRLRQGLALNWYCNLDNLVGRDMTVRESPIHVHPQNI